MLLYRHVYEFDPDSTISETLVVSVVLLGIINFLVWLSAASEMGMYGFLIAVAIFIINIW